jgi:hypothetical protein
MKTSIDHKIEAARRRVRGTNRAQALGARSPLELQAAARSWVRSSSTRKPDLKPEAVVAKAAAARNLLRRD